jgi:hypothetical protein
MRHAILNIACASGCKPAGDFRKHVGPRYDESFGGEKVETAEGGRTQKWGDAREIVRLNIMMAITGLGAFLQCSAYCTYCP